MSDTFLSATTQRATDATQPTGGVQDQRKIWEVYEKKDVLGTGAFGTVYRALDRVTGTVVAVKQLQKDADSRAEQEALAEFKTCAKLSHPHVMRVYSYFDSAQAVYIVSELAAGGELNDYLARHKELNTETGIANVASQVLAALIYMHSEQMVHHDIKPQNVLVTAQKWSRDPSGTTPIVVLGDFGTARLCRAARRATVAQRRKMSRKMTLAAHGAAPLAGAAVVDDVLGTPEYCGPEVFVNQSGPRTDVYALGVTLFELLAGEKPFEVVWADLFDFDADPDDAAARYAQMRDPDLPADLSRLKGVSAEGVACIGRMLSKSFGARPTAKEASEDAWFGRAGADDAYFNPKSRRASALCDAEMDARAARMHRRAAACCFGKALTSLVASRLSDETLRRERALFMRADGGLKPAAAAAAAASGEGVCSGGVCFDGKLDAAELAALFASRGWDEESAAAAVAALDLDGNRGLGFNEWIAATMDLDVLSSGDGGAAVAKQIASLFDEMDRNGDGLVDPAELRAHFGGKLSDEQAAAFDAFFEGLDADGDGKVSRRDFESFWRRV